MRTQGIVCGPFYGRNDAEDPTNQALDKRVHARKENKY